MSLAYNPEEALAALALADPVMGRLIDEAGPFTLTVRALDDPFQSLVRSIIYQQLSGRVAAAIHGRLCALFPEGRVRPDLLLDLEEELLRGAGLSRAKAAAVRDLAAKTLDETVPTLDRLKTMADEEIVARLTRVRGIGPWTVEMLLIFRLGRPDVLPVTDLGVRKGFMHTYGLEALPAPGALRAHGERWRPYRSVASWYLWRAVDLRSR